MTEGSAPAEAGGSAASAPGSARPEVSGTRVARNTVLNLAGQAIPLAMAFFAMRYLLHGLGAERFGVLSIVWLVVGYSMVVGFGSAATKHVAAALGREPERVPALVRAAMRMQLAIGLLGGVLLLLFAEPLAGALLDLEGARRAEAARALRWVSLAIPIAMVSTVFQGVLEAAQRFDLVNAVRMPSILATFALPLAGMWLGYDLAGIAMLLVAGRVVVLAAHALLARRAVPELRSRTPAQGGEARAILRFGAWASVSTVVAPALHLMDRLGLGMIAGAAAVGLYTAPFEVVTRLRMVPAALVMSLFPAISSLHGSGDPERGVRLALRSMHLVLLSMGLASIALIGGAHDLLRLWLGDDVARAAGPATQLLGAALALNSVAYVPWVLLQGQGRPDIPARLYLAQVPVQLLVVWLCVSQWGITGAALAWALHVTMDSLLMTGAAARLNGRRLRDMYDTGARRTGLLLVAGGAVAAGISSMGDGFVLRMVALAFTLATVATLAWRWSLDEADRSRLVALARGYLPERLRAYQ